jgi:hypothetical protein
MLSFQDYFRRPLRGLLDALPAFRRASRFRLPHSCARVLRLWQISLTSKSGVATSKSEASKLRVFRLIGILPDGF